MSRNLLIDSCGLPYEHDAHGCCMGRARRQPSRRNEADRTPELQALQDAATTAAVAARLAGDGLELLVNFCRSALRDGYRDAELVTVRGHYRRALAEARRAVEALEAAEDGIGTL